MIRVSFSMSVGVYIALTLMALVATLLLPYETKGRPMQVSIRLHGEVHHCEIPIKAVPWYTWSPQKGCCCWLTFQRPERDSSARVLLSHWKIFHPFVLVMPCSQLNPINSQKRQIKPPRNIYPLQQELFCAIRSFPRVISICISPCRFFEVVKTVFCQKK